jgi:hypothetical protein
MSGPPESERHAPERGRLVVVGKEARDSGGKIEMHEVA